MANGSQYMSTLDPFGLGEAMAAVWSAALKDPKAIAAAQTKLAADWLTLLERASRATAGAPAEALVAPSPGDRRFSDPAWTENPSLAFAMQAYLLASESIAAAIDALPDVDAKTKRKAKFWMKELTDAMSPSNVAWLNPTVIEATVRTGGKNLVEGLQHLLDDVRENDGRVSLVDRKAFHIGENIATTPGKVVLRNELCELIRYTPTTPQVHERPILFVPPWINKFYILDLQPANSVVKYLTDAGYTTYIISWRNPDSSMAGISMDDYIRIGADACARAIAKHTHSPSINIVGYCLGGTIVAEYLAYLAARGDTLINAATFFASLVDFSDPGDLANFTGEDAIAFVEQKMSERGYLSGREMGDTFNMLRANDLIWTVAVNRYLLGKDAPAFDLLYWNDDATRMPKAMHSYYLRHMYLNNDLIKPGALAVEGTPIDVHAIPNDCFVVATSEDHIAPWKSVYRLTQLIAGNAVFRLGQSGHIAGIINPPSEKQKGGYWENSELPSDADGWFASATLHKGSWWPDWTAWLNERSGPMVAPPKMGRTLGDAPGTYVLERS